MDRRIERLELGKWVTCEMKDLQAEDIFRMFEPSGKPVQFGAKWIVNGTPYFKDGTWGVACESIGGEYE